MQDFQKQMYRYENQIDIAEESKMGKTLLKRLKEREKNVINWRFGFDDIKKKTLEEIGQFYGVTKECVRQTELRAIKKLKFAMETDFRFEDNSFQN